MPDRKKLQKLGTDGGIDPKSLAPRGGEAGRVRKVIQKLTPPHRMVLVLRDMEGFTDEEVAEITGLRSGTVRVRLHRARLLVRNELMKGTKPRSGRAAVSRAPASAQPARCKTIFAELSDYLDDKLDHPLRQELKRHLKGCPPCQALLASLKATVEQCRRSPVEGLNRKRTAILRTKVLADYQRMIAKSRRQS